MKIVVGFLLILAFNFIVVIGVMASAIYAPDALGCAALVAAIAVVCWMAHDSLYPSIDGL